MIIQYTMAKNELHFIKELLPIWSKYADGFIFLLDTCTDGSYEYLQSVQEQFNIKEILKLNRSISGKKIEKVPENTIRQLAFNKAKKYSNKIICLDADEYLDGQWTKNELENYLGNNENCVLFLQWIQYTNKNTIRTDEPWKVNFKDRIGNYKSNFFIEKKYKHTTHLPIPNTIKNIELNNLFIAHLSWVNKIESAIKQYYWKIDDYVMHKNLSIEIIDIKEYDISTNNFEWQEEMFDYDLKIELPIKYPKFNWKLDMIKKWTKDYNVPNLGDWGYNILEIDNGE
jgi:hypothetical protein